MIFTRDTYIIICYQCVYNGCIILILNTLSIRYRISYSVDDNKLLFAISYVTYLYVISNLQLRKFIEILTKIEDTLNYNNIIYVYIITETVW